MYCPFVADLIMYCYLLNMDDLNVPNITNIIFC